MEFNHRPSGISTTQKQYSINNIHFVDVDINPIGISGD